MAACCSRAIRRTACRRSARAAPTSGVQDADNLGWKLTLVIDGQAPDALLDTYASEREAAADENIRHSTRSTDFITPKSDVSRVFRDAALRLAKDCEFARRIVNSGRLSTASVLHDSPLNTPDRDAFALRARTWFRAADAPVRFDGRDAWFLPCVGSSFAGVLFGPSAAGLDALKTLSPHVKPILIVPAGSSSVSQDGVEILEDVEGLLAKRFDGKPGTFYLVRPDQHIAMRARTLDLIAVREALARATCAPERSPIGVTRPMLDTTLRLADPDAFYEALIDMHRDLADAQSQLVNAKLILLLSNQIGDMDVLREAMSMARRDVAGSSMN